MEKISDLINQKNQELAELKKRQTLSYDNLKNRWERKIELSRKKNERELRQKSIERKKARRRREIAQTPYHRVVYLQQLKKDREAMEAYKEEKGYICELCSTRGMEPETFKQLYELPETVNLHTDTKGLVVHIKLPENRERSTPLYYSLRKYIMTHHKHEGEGLQCVCRWCHDKLDQDLRAQGRTSKAIDKAAIMAEVQRILKETAGHATQEKGEQGNV